jgi:hypothetical protein
VKFSANFTLGVNIEALFEAFSKCEGFTERHSGNPDDRRCDRQARSSQIDRCHRSASPQWHPSAGLAGRLRCTRDVRVSPNTDSCADALGSGRDPDRTGRRLDIILAGDSHGQRHLQPQAPASPAARLRVHATTDSSRAGRRPGGTTPHLPSADGAGSVCDGWRRGHRSSLRTRATTLAHLQRAMELTTARVGNPTRRQLLLDSRSEPWSEAERSLHRLLRAAGITGPSNLSGVR